MVLVFFAGMACSCRCGSLPPNLEKPLLQGAPASVINSAAFTLPGIAMFTAILLAHLPVDRHG